MNNKGFTVLEILVAAMIIAISVVGLAEVFVVGKKFILHSRSRVASAEIARFFVDPLQKQVRQDQWETTSCLGNPASCSGSSWTLNNINYAVAWSVTERVPGSKIRKVIANISWVEPQ